MQFNNFDLIILGISLIFAIKGFFNGIIKEISGLIGIIVGIYVASNYYIEAGKFINESIFKIQNESAINVVGFISLFIIGWLSIVIIGVLISHIVKIAQLGILDRIGGVVFSAGKIFVIIAIIVTLLSKIEAMHNQLNKWSKDSVIYPYILKIGNLVINLKPKEVKKSVDSIQEKLSKEIVPVIKKKIEENQKVISDEISKNLKPNKGE